MFKNNIIITCARQKTSGEILLLSSFTIRVKKIIPLATNSPLKKTNKQTKKPEMPNICQIQPLKYEDFFVFYDIKLNS